MGKIEVHQCIIGYSKLLKQVLLASEIQALSKPILIFADFSSQSVELFLKFLYTGAVELRKGTETLNEFMELCRILKVNPPVTKKYEKDKENQHTKSSKNTTVISRCKVCDKKFDMPSKLQLHIRRHNHQQTNEENGRKERVDPPDNEHANDVNVDTRK